MSMRSKLSLILRFLVLAKKERIVPFKYSLIITSEEFDENFNAYRSKEPLGKIIRFTGWTNKGHIRVYVNHMEMDEDNVLRSAYEYMLKGTHSQCQNKCIITGHIFMDDENRLAIFYSYFALIGFLFLLGVCLVEKKPESFIVLLICTLFFLIPAIIPYFHKIYTIRSYSKQASILISNYLKDIENYTFKKEE